MRAEALAKAVGSFSQLNVLVIGDIMWDHYVIGQVERISPEAPVPVLQVSSERGNLGGAGNVAANLRAIGAGVYLAGVVGSDQSGASVRAELRRLGIDDGGVIEDASRPTTVKMRVLGRNQQVVRVDWESRDPVCGTTASLLMEYLGRVLRSVQAVVISDYAKGMVTPELMEGLVASLPAGLSVLVDPKGEDYTKYSGVSVLTPNEREAWLATGRKIKEFGDVGRAGQALLELLPSLRAVYITRGEQGIWVAPRGHRPHNVPAVSTEVYDVTGAGDTVISVLALSLATGLGWGEAAVLANLAASLVIRKLGCAVVTQEELLRLVGTEAALSYCQEVGVPGV